MRFQEAYWQSQIEATPANDEARAELELELRALLGDPQTLERIEAALSEDLHEPLLRRQLELLRLSFVANQMTDQEREQIVALSTQIESEFASFRAEVDGRSLNDNDIDEVLKVSNDTHERKRVWLGSKQVGAAVAERVRELVRLRNAAARKLGFADHYRMSLELQELDESWLFETMDGLEKATEAPFFAWKAGLDDELRRRFGVGELGPWHYADPFFQQPPPDGRVDLDSTLGDLSAPDLAVETFRRWGIDLTGVMGRSDLYPRDLKCQHAFCISIDRRDDVRILANVVPGERWIDTMLHESGHAAYDVSIDRRLPHLLREPSHIFVTEAVALLAGRMTRQPGWLTGVAGLSEDRIEALRPELRAATASQVFQFARWGLVMVHFERDLYSDPEADLDTMWWDYVERFQGVTLTRAEAPADAWASKIHIAVAPAYYQNYLLGDMLASQIVASAGADPDDVIGSERVGELLKDGIFRPGASQRWDELIAAATGAPLDAGHLAEEMAL